MNSYWHKIVIKIFQDLVKHLPLDLTFKNLENYYDNKQYFNVHLNILILFKNRFISISLSFMLLL